MHYQSGHLFMLFYYEAHKAECVNVLDSLIYAPSLLIRTRLTRLNGYFKGILYEVCLNAPESAKFTLTTMGLSPTLAPVPTASGRQYGEVSEWLKEHAWKVCIRQRIEGSNPSLTAIFKERACTQVRAFLHLYLAIPGRDENPRPGFDRRFTAWTAGPLAGMPPKGPNLSLPHRHIQRKSLS